MAGKKIWAVGGIFLVCYNLPRHLRFHRENICLIGIIPGPRQPSGDELNHFLQPLVASLDVLWTTGIWYSQTSCYPTGRLVRAALGPVICDLQGSRPVSGFTAFNAMMFCSRCMIHLHQLAHLLTLRALPLRDPSTHRSMSYSLTQEPSATRRDKLEKENGVRWSILLQLEYWDPVRCTVIDIMHNGFLGNFETHIRDVWGQNLEKLGDDGSAPSHRLPPNADAERRLKLVLARGGGRDALEYFDPTTLESACWDRSLGSEVGPNPNKTPLIEALLRLVSSGVVPARNRQCIALTSCPQRSCIWGTSEPSDRVNNETILLAIPTFKWATRKSIKRVMLRVANDHRASLGEPNFGERSISNRELAEYIEV